MYQTVAPANNCFDNHSRHDTCILHFDLYNSFCLALSGFKRRLVVPATTITLAECKGHYCHDDASFLRFGINMRKLFDPLDISHYKAINWKKWSDVLTGSLTKSTVRLTVATNKCLTVNCTSGVGSILGIALSKFLIPRCETQMYRRWIDSRDRRQELGFGETTIFNTSIKKKTPKSTQNLLRITSKTWCCKQKNWGIQK